MPKSRRTLTVVIVDTSVSMNRYRDSVCAVVNRVVEGLRGKNDHRIVVYGIAESTEELIPLSSSGNAKSFKCPDFHGESRFVSGLADILNSLSRLQIYARVNVIVLTTGEDTLSSWQEHFLLQNTSKAALNNGIQTRVYGYGRSAQGIAGELHLPASGKSAIDGTERTYTPHRASHLQLAASYRSAVG
jgi:hypothetical protein